MIDGDYLENLGTTVDKLDLKTNEETKKGANQWVTGNHEFGEVNVDAGSSISFFPTPAKKLMLVNLAGGAPAGSYAKKMSIAGAGWIEGNHDIDYLQAKPGSDVILSSTPEKK